MGRYIDCHAKVRRIMTRMHFLYPSQFRGLILDIALLSQRALSSARGRPIIVDVRLALRPGLPQGILDEVKGFQDNGLLLMGKDVSYSFVREINTLMYLERASPNHLREVRKIVNKMLGGDFMRRLGEQVLYYD